MDKGWQNLGMLAGRGHRGMEKVCWCPELWTTQWIFVYIACPRQFQGGIRLPCPCQVKLTRTRDRNIRVDIRAGKVTVVAPTLASDPLGTCYIKQRWHSTTIF
ncbi:hypothetical protein PoB_002732100 [Plakobranchus ocellatus]|uniref:Uncharacterized protein n=1 Tax=Plakobranchus ocellatus TaxID=259542 RepID=A0AAV3ZY34_9GAST|nr:hypothetical protein PoB_002732100 [Plakobranchus ocellatus]